MFSSAVSLGSGSFQGHPAIRPSGRNQTRPLVGLRGTRPPTHCRCEGQPGPPRTVGLGGTRPPCRSEGSRPARIVVVVVETDACTDRPPVYILSLGTLIACANANLSMKRHNNKISEHVIKKDTSSKFREVRFNTFFFFFFVNLHKF